MSGAAKVASSVFIEEHVAIDSDDAIVTARRLARDGARNLGFSVLDQARIATAVSELARNDYCRRGIRPKRLAGSSIDVF